MCPVKWRLYIHPHAGLLFATATTIGPILPYMCLVFDAFFSECETRTLQPSHTQSTFFFYFSWNKLKIGIFCFWLTTQWKEHTFFYAISVLALLWSRQFNKHCTALFFYVFNFSNCFGERIEEEIQIKKHQRFIVT